MNNLKLITIENKFKAIVIFFLIFLNLKTFQNDRVFAKLYILFCSKNEIILTTKNHSIKKKWNKNLIKKIFNIKKSLNKFIRNFEVKRFQSIMN